MNQEQYSTVIQTLWQLAVAGLSDLTIKNISLNSGLDESEIQLLFPNQYNVILAMISDIKSRSPLPRIDGRLTNRDQIFDGAMMYFDSAQPYREAIKKIYDDVIWSPFILARVLPELYKLGEEITRRYSSVEGFSQSGRVLAFNGAFIHAFRVFIEDDTFDLSKTMAALDQGLKTAEDLLQRFK